MAAEQQTAALHYRKRFRFHYYDAEKRGEIPFGVNVEFQMSRTVADGRDGRGRVL